jgi:valyl-tRNA synthetase
MALEISKSYEPGIIEEKWYEYWQQHGYFTPDIDRNKKPFVVIMPPLNVTGVIHMGHAVALTIEDIIVRWHRMKGDPTLWLPGTDHAGIATQIIIEKQLSERGVTREEIGRKKFLEIAWQWTNDTRDNIYRQNKMLGASCDWTRDRFTLDEGPGKAVRSTFVRLYDKGLIYRGERIINWCPRCQTALSDLEVEHKDIMGHLYYIKYQLKDEDGFITIATTRPETLLGDTAIAVSASDKRYKKLIGKEVILPLLNRNIPILADEAVDPSFGTGALKITPAHDPTDFEVGKRHGLPVIDIMNTNATMNNNAGPYTNLERLDCRDKVLADLQESGLLEKVEPYMHSVGHCGRCKTMIEPRVSTQWFIQTKPLAEPAIEVVKNGSVTIIPEHFTKVYFDWMENIKDWCISRQLWWGHRIPVWYCQKCGKLTVSEEDPTACKYCNSKEIIQDPDVLDTWFSSALWPHSTLGWPEDSEDLRYFYPTSVMETGYDILFFWVARMIMMGLENTGNIPFHTVYLNGLIRDEHGEKMSKMRGNVINPVEVIKEIGVDALRFALTTGTAPGNDINLGADRVESSRNFTNKLWNASRFILQNLELAIQKGYKFSAVKQEKLTLSLDDRWINSRLNRLINNTNKLMENFQFGEAEQELYAFLWSEYCDWYIEFSKIRIRSGNMEYSPLVNLATSLEKLLRLLHPFMPFVTEELWQCLKNLLANRAQYPDSIMIAPYPIADESLIDYEAEKIIDTAINIIRSIRNVRAEYTIKSNQYIEARVYTGDTLESLTSLHELISSLARVNPLSILRRKGRETDNDKSMVIVLNETEVVLPWTGPLDVSLVYNRLIKERDSTQERIEQINVKLTDRGFLNNAPPHIVEKEKENLRSFVNKLNRLEAEIAQIGGKVI